MSTVWGRKCCKGCNEPEEKGKVAVVAGSGGVWCVALNPATVVKRERAKVPRVCAVVNAGNKRGGSVRVQSERTTCEVRGEL